MFTLSAFADESSKAVVGQIDALRRNQIPYLEIRGVDGENIKDITRAKAREVRSMLDDAGLAVWSIGSPIGKHHLEQAFEPHFDDFKRVLEYADILGATRIRMFSFYPAPDTSAEATREAVLEGLQKFLDATPDHIVLCHENEKKIFGENTENCLAIHQTFPKLRAVFDPANFIQCGVNTLEAWDALAPYVDYMHIKDANADGVVVPAGKGIGNLPELIRRYGAMGGKVMTLEPHLKVFSGLEKLEDGESVKEGVTLYRSNEEAFDAAVSALKSILATL